MGMARGAALVGACLVGITLPGCSGSGEDTDTPTRPAVRASTATEAPGAKHAVDAPQPPKPQPPEFVVIRVGRVEVAPHDAAGGDWDGEAREDDLAQDCRALAGVAANFGTPETRAVAAGLRIFGCELVFGEEKQQQSDPRLPDLRLRLGDAAVEYLSYIAFDQMKHVFNYDFFVPMKALGAAGFVLAVVDADDDDEAGRVIGSRRITPDQLAAAAALGEVLDLAGSEPLLHRLEVDVFPHDGSKLLETVTVDVSKGGGPIAGFHVAAGQRVKLKAEGAYRIGSWSDKEIGPEGYPGGGPVGYNLKHPAFKDVAHGATVAFIGERDALHPITIDPCRQFIAPYSGTVWVGVNDDDFRNNTGKVKVRALHRPSTVSQWREKSQNLPCK